MIFVGASTIPDLALSTNPLISARPVQGIGAAAIRPNSMALLVNAFLHIEARARALGSLSALSAIALVTDQSPARRVPGWHVGMASHRSRR
jgi:MFS family permease